MLALSNARKAVLLSVFALLALLLVVMPAGDGYADGSDERIASGGARFDGVMAAQVAANDLAVAKVGKIEPCVYRGYRLKPEVTVSVGAKKLRAGIDYRVTYLANNKPGWAKAVVIGQGDYTGKVSKRFLVKKRKVVMVGDSFAKAWSKGPAEDHVTKPWPELMAAKLGLDDGQWKVYREGGYGFTRPGRQFKLFFRNVKRDNAVTDVLIVGGAGNDRSCTRSQIEVAYAQFASLMRAKYPNARIMHTITSWSFASASYRAKMIERIPWYKAAALRNGVNYLKGCASVLRSHPEWTRSDRWHPNQKGHNAMARVVYKKVRELDKAM